MPEGGNCFCAAGASQSCVHIPALLFTSATAFTSVKCAWARPSVGNKTSASFSKELDYGTASQEGYFPYDDPKLLVDTHLKNLVHAGSKLALVDFLGREKARYARKSANTTSGVLFP